METPPPAHRPHPKSKFTVEEDIFLRSLVAQFGENNWQQIARNMPKRNPRQCKERWMNYLSPMVRNTPWTPEEDELLKRKVAELGQKWVRIAKFFPMRTDINIKNRFLVLMRRSRKEAPREPEVQQETPFVEIVSDLMPPLFIKRSLLPPKKVGLFVPIKAGPICDVASPPKMAYPLNLTSYLKA